MQRRDFGDDVCPVARTMNIIGEWWTILILRDAFSGITRFREFQESLGVAKNILTVRLRKLVDEGVFEMVPASDGSSYQEYVLTAKGKSLYTVMVAMRQWGQNHLFAPDERPSVLVDTLHSEPIRNIEVRSRAGKLLGPDDITLARMR